MPAESKPAYLRKLNDSLSVAIILLSVYIFLWPVWPNLGWWLRSLGRQNITVNQQNIPPAQPPRVIADHNQLVIPRLDMAQTINEGQTPAALRKGVWRRPLTSSPDRGGNTVLVGHRFTYSDPAVFYHLDKIELNDLIIIDWQKQEYTYRVDEIKIVPPTEAAVEQNTAEPILTLYTCTPLWTARDRLVIKAKLFGVRG